MAAKSKVDKQLRDALAENKALKAENKKLKREAAKSSPAKSGPSFGTRFWRKLFSIFFIALAVAVLMVGNILFWAGNTVVKNDRFSAATAPIIKDPVVQQAVAAYTTQQIFSNVDVQGAITNVLPPRADFLAPTLANQLKSNTQKVLQTTLARPAFQDRFNKALSKSHAAFISTIANHGGDGTIDLNDVYQQVSGNLTGTKLAFLANKKLPNKVGSVKVADGPEISIAHRVITHIDAWRNAAIVVFILSAIAGILLSFRRRRAVIRLTLIIAAVMFFTLVALRVTREAAAGSADPMYAEAVRHVMRTIFHPLVIQTATLMIASLIVAVVAWLSGPSKGATKLKTSTNQLLNGKLHQAMFGGNENSLTLWVGSQKRTLQWAVIVITGLAVLIVKLTPLTLLISVIIMLILVLLIETLAAPAAQPRKA